MFVKAPSVYPIIFSAIIGRALKNIGRYRAERGSRVSVSTYLGVNHSTAQADI
jgi:hypothetical protein